MLVFFQVLVLEGQPQEAEHSQKHGVPADPRDGPVLARIVSAAVETAGSSAMSSGLAMASFAGHECPYLMTILTLDQTNSRPAAHGTGGVAFQNAQGSRCDFMGQLQGGDEHG